MALCGYEELRHVKLGHFEELTVGSFSSSSVDPLEKLSRPLRIARSPELLKYIKDKQCLGFRFFEHPLVIPKPSLQLRRASQKVFVIDRVQLGTLNVSVCVVESLLSEKRPCQDVMSPK